MISSFVACVPDMEIFTEGESFADAIEKVKQDTEDIDFSKGVLTYVDVDFSEYRKKVDTKTVRRNVALPSWLNYEAEHAGINVSRVLQEALMNVLNVKRNI